MYGMSCILLSYSYSLLLSFSATGIITEKLQDKVFWVNFLHPHQRKKHVFVYPEVPDIQTVWKDMIVKFNVDLLPCTSSYREWRVDGFSL